MLYKHKSTLSKELTVWPTVSWCLHCLGTVDLAPRHKNQSWKNRVIAFKCDLFSLNLPWFTQLLFPALFHSPPGFSCLIFLIIFFFSDIACLSSLPSISPFASVSKQWFWSLPQVLANAWLSLFCYKSLFQMPEKARAQLDSLSIPWTFLRFQKFYTLWIGMKILNLDNFYNLKILKYIWHTWSE